MTHEIVNQLRSLRKQHKITQTQLAEISGVSLPTISRMERGKESIRLDVLVKIVESLGYQLTIQPQKRGHDE